MVSGGAGFKDIFGCDPQKFVSCKAEVSNDILLCVIAVVRWRGDTAYPAQLSFHPAEKNNLRMRVNVNYHELNRYFSNLGPNRVIY